MPSDKGNYPFPYKTTGNEQLYLDSVLAHDGNFTNLETSNLVADNAEVGNLTADTLTVSSISTAHYTATDPTLQYRTSAPSLDFVVGTSASPVFNFKDASGNTNTTIIESGNFIGTNATLNANSNSAVFTNQSNFGSGSNVASGFAAQTSLDEMDMFMNGNTSINPRRGQIRTSSTAFGLDIDVQGSGKSLKMKLNSSPQLSMDDTGVQIPTLGATTPGSVRSTTMNSQSVSVTGVGDYSDPTPSIQSLGGILVAKGVQSSNLNLTSTQDASAGTPSLKTLGGLNVAKQIVAGGIQATPIGNSVPSTGNFSSVGTGNLNVSSTQDATDTVPSIQTLGGVKVTKQIIAGGIQNTPIGQTTPSTANFTSTASGNIALSSTQDATDTTPSIQTLGGIKATKSLVAGSIQNTPLGSTTPSTGNFTTLNSTSSTSTSISTTNLTTNNIHSTSTTDIVSGIAPNQFDGGLIVNKTLQSARLNTTDTTDLSISVGVNVVNSVSAPNNIVGGLTTVNSYGKSLTLYNPDAGTPTALLVVKGNTAITTMTADAITSVIGTIGTLGVTGLGDYNSIVPPPALNVFGGASIVKSVSAFSLISTSSNDYSSSSPSLSITGGANIGLTVQSQKNRITDTSTSDKFGVGPFTCAGGGYFNKNLFVNSNVNATSTATGALVLTNGGAGIAGDVWSANTFTGQGKFSDSTNATSTTTGSVQMTGGLGVAKDIWCANLFGSKLALTDATNATSTTTGSVTLAGGLGVAKDIWSANVFSGQGKFSDVTNATSTGTGSVQLAGGLGVAKDIWSANLFTGKGTFSDATEATSTTSGAVQITGGIGVAKTMFANNVNSATGNFSSTVNASSTTTGSVRIAGGVGVAEDLYAANLNATTAVKCSTVTATANIKGDSMTCTTDLATATVTATGLIEAADLTATAAVTAVDCTVTGVLTAPIIATLQTEVTAAQADATTALGIATGAAGGVATLTTALAVTNGNVSTLTTRVNGIDSELTPILAAITVNGTTHNTDITASGVITANSPGTGLVVTNNQTVGGTLAVTSSTTCTGLISATKASGTGLAVTSDATVGGNLTTTGTTTSTGLVSANKASGTGLAVTSNATIGGNLVVSGTISGTYGASSVPSLSVTGAGTALTVTNSASVGGTLTVTGAITGTSAHFTGSGTGTSAAVYCNNNMLVNGLLQVGDTTTPGRLKFATSATDYTLIGVDAVDDANNSRIIISGISRSGAAGVNQYIALGNSHNFYGSATTIGSSIINCGAITASADSSFTGSLGVGNGTVGVVVSGASTFNGNVAVSGTNTTTLNGAVSCAAAGTGLAVTNNMTVGGNLTVTGTVSGTFGASSVSSLAVTGAGTALTVTNNQTVGGTLGVTGAITGTSAHFTGSGTGTSAAVYCNNNMLVNGLLQVGDTTTPGRLKFATSATDYTLIGVDAVDDANNSRIIISGISRSGAAGVNQYIALGNSHNFYGSATTIGSSIINCGAITASAAVSMPNKIQTGVGALASNGTITFPTAFSTIPYVVCTANTPVVAGSPQYGISVTVTISLLGTNQFNYGKTFFNTSTGAYGLDTTTGFSWVAVAP